MKTLEIPLDDQAGEEPEPPSATTAILPPPDIEATFIDLQPLDYRHAYLAGHASISESCIVDPADIEVAIQSVPDEQLDAFYHNRTRKGIKHFLGALGVGSERYKARTLAPRLKPNLEILFNPEVVLDFTTTKSNAADTTKLLYVLSDELADELADS